MNSSAHESMTASDVATMRLPTNWHSPDLIESLPAAVYVCDAGAVVVAYNHRAAELWGREPVLGDTDAKFCGSYRMFLPDGTFLPHRECPMEWVLRTGQPARDQEVVIERPDGSRITVLVNIAPLFDEDDKLVGAVNCFQDLTVQKQAEHERARLVEELHQAKKMEALGQLTAAVAHDFNNLLTAILGSLELLKDRASDDASLRLFGSIIGSAQRGAELNAQLLGFARRQTLLPKAIDLNQVLAGMTDLLRTTVREMIRIDLRPQTNPWLALVDPNQIALIILNLVINARDAMPTGGTLTIETRNATFRADDCPEGVSPGDYVALAIGDTGTGMSEEVRALAFQPFFTTKQPGGGSGLGLSMVLGVATGSGGGVRVDTELGRGTSIEIFLPRAGQAAPSGSEAARSSHVATEGEVVLVVDDDNAVREVTAGMLASLDYTALEAESGPPAMAILATTQQVDLMLIDIGMPGMNGVEAVRRARELRPDLPVLFATGYSEFGSFAAGELDINLIMRKPYRRDELSEKIRACLNGKTRF